MAYTIKLAKFKKVKNSTEIPLTFTITLNNVLLKENCSLVNPVLNFTYNADADDIIDYNYMLAFGKYYYIDDIISLNNNRWEIHATRDPMASFKDDIADYSGYITRTNDETKYDVNLYDNLIAPSSEIVTTINVEEPTKFTLGETTTVFGFNGSGGVRTSADVGNFYYTTSANASSILGRVFCTSNDIFTTIIQNFQQISHNITMVKSFPFAKADTSRSSSSVYVGEWSVACADLETMSVSNFATTTNGRRWGDIITLDIPSDIHYMDYRDYDSNFVEVILHTPLIGSISINPQYLRYDKLELTYEVDLISGIGECTIRAYSTYNGENKYMVLGVYNFVAGYDVPISAYTENVGQIASNIIGLNPTGVIIDAIAPPISYTTLSSGSGLANVYLDKVVLEIKVMGSENFTFGHERGKKYMKYDTISNFSNNGTYIECMSPHCKLTGATPQEIDTVNNYLQGGFYYYDS